MVTIIRFHRFHRVSERSLLNIVNDLEGGHTYHISSSYYYTDPELYIILQNNHYFSVLSVNTQSLPAKFTDITLFVDGFLKHNCYVDVIHLQDSWITNHTCANFDIPDIKIYIQPAICSTHSGLITYVKTSFLSTKLNNITNQNTIPWKSLFIEIEKCNKTVIVGNTYSIY